MSAVALRFANIYGPGSSHKRSVVAEFCKSALRGEPLTIFGDGSQTRDFLYVDDLLVAIHGCLGRPDISGVFQMGCGFGVSVLDVAGVIQGLREGQGPQVPPPDFRPARAFEVHDCYYRIDKAGDAFGFNPSVGFREGVQRTWTWFQKNATGREAATGSSE
jgi:UDP-glucose 4-epimerase